MKLQLTNIARDVSVEDLKKLFEKLAPGAECVLVMDKVTGLSKGFGFVEIADKALAQKAVDLVHGRLVNGQKIKVKLAAQ